jgi:hypothetical protein
MKKKGWRRKEEAKKSVCGVYFTFIACLKPRFIPLQAVTCKPETVGSDGGSFLLVPTWQYAKANSLPKVTQTFFMQAPWRSFNPGKPKVWTLL